MTSSIKFPLTSERDAIPDVSIAGGRYVDRDLSWLKFNERVLEEALDESNPLLERLKFLAIVTSNQDEFFMIRVAGIKRLLKEGATLSDGPDEKPLASLLSEITEQSQDLLSRQYACLHGSLLPALAARGVAILKCDRLKPSQRAHLNDYFTRQIKPVLTPFAVDPSHPFPFLSNLSLCMLVEFEPNRLLPQNAQPIAFVEIPAGLPRLVRLSDTPDDVFHYVLLEDLIHQHLSRLFLGFEVRTASLVRVIRNHDYYFAASEVVDLLETIEKKLVNIDRQSAVRLEVQGEPSPAILRKLTNVLGLGPQDIYQTPCPIFLPSLMSLTTLPLPDLKALEFNPRLPDYMAGNRSIFSLIKEKDRLVHHPFESFYAVIEFLATAAADPDVIAIKQTLYRSSGDSPIIEVLIRAADQGKHVTAVVELKARFDEKNNIQWARRLERAGVNVVYGFIGLKTHCKATLIVRREHDTLVNYTHLSTGNYNSQTAKFYTDLGYFTAHEGIGGDVSELFNLLTGFDVLVSNGSEISDYIPQFKHIAVAPIFLRERLLLEIDKTIRSQGSGGSSLIMAKMNSLSDKKLIDKLYEASQAGVKIRLMVRGICCLRPGVAGLSENIEVISLVDRFLEHSRIYYFQAGDEAKLYLGSADLMSRNMDARIEILYPIESEELKKRILLEILNTYWLDNCKARQLQADGSYRKKTASEANEKVRAQQRFIDLARQVGIKSLPYDKAIQHIVKKDKSRPVAPQPNKRK